jgi:hypothetical protein
MALTTTPLGTPLNYTIIIESDAGASMTSAIEDVFDGPCVVNSVEIQNTGVSATASRILIWDSTGQNLTLGTTKPKFILPATASDTTVWDFYVKDATPNGVPMANGVTLIATKAVTTTDDGNEVTTAPDDTIVVRMSLSAAA